MLTAHEKNIAGRSGGMRVIMTKTGFVKGMSIGVVTGAAIGMVFAPRGRNSKRTAGRALKAAGEVIDNITGMWS
jgi:gas vesicle protein